MGKLPTLAAMFVGMNTGANGILSPLMPNALQDRPDADPLKRRVKFRLRWALLALAAALACRYFGFKELEQAFGVGGVVLLVLHYVSSSYIVLSRKAIEETPEPEPEEFSIRFPEPDEHSFWHYTVVPSTTVYTEVFCGGDWQNTSTFQYSVKDERIFSRLVDLLEEGWRKNYYTVVNGQVLEAEIRSREPFDSTDQHIEGLKKDVTWNEVTGSLRYFILSKHGCSLSVFLREKERLTKAFAALAEKATELDAVRPVGGLVGGYYKAKDGASERTKAAIKELQTAESLEHFRLSFRELKDYEHIIQTLDELLADKSAAASV